MSAMISVAQLDCLDLLIWLRLGSAVHHRFGFSEPSISRALDRVSDAFGVRIVKHDGGWHVLGDVKLINLERLVHQRMRWFADIPLRIDSQYYSASLLRDFLSTVWIKGNLDFMEVRAPLEYLRQVVIDAWIGFFPDVPEEDDRDLCCVHLARLPLHLIVSANHPLVALGDGITLADLKCYPFLPLSNHASPKFQADMQALGLLNFPTQIQYHNYAKWEGLIADSETIGYATTPMINLFNSSHVLLPIRIPLEVGESLVVRSEYATHPRFEALVVDLKSRAVELKQRFSDVHLCF